MRRPGKDDGPDAAGEARPVAPVRSAPRTARAACRSSDGSEAERTDDPPVCQVELGEIVAGHSCQRWDVSMEVIRQFPGQPVHIGSIAAPGGQALSESTEGGAGALFNGSEYGTVPVFEHGQLLFAVDVVDQDLRAKVGQLDFVRLERRADPKFL